MRRPAPPRRCTTCRRVWRQDTTAAAEPKAKLSRTAVRWALEALVLQHLTVARVAEGLDVAWDTANDAVLVQLAQKTQPAFLWREPFLPMVNTAIKASFAERRSYVYDGKTVDEQNHLGLDMASVRADPVPASNDGVVVFASYLGIYGNCVVIDHGYGLETRYGHLLAFSVGKDDQVKRGDVIGQVGSTGRATGNHLHYEVLANGTLLNPLRLLTNQKPRDQ